jgi:hypothetical protein
MATRFTAIPEIPTSGIPEIQANILGSLKENVELLTATRGEFDLISRALARGDVTVKQIGLQDMGSVQNISPEGFTISSQDVAGLVAFRALKTDVQQLANDVFETRAALDKLIKDFGGS